MAGRFYQSRATYRREASGQILGYGSGPKQSAELVFTLLNVTIAFQQDGTAEQRLQNIGAFLGSDPNRLLERCDSSPPTPWNYL